MSQSGPPPNDNNSVIIAGGCSRYDNNTDVTSIGTVTAALQLQQGRSDQPISSDVPRLACGDRPMINVLSGAQSTDRSLPVTTQHDVTLTTNSFNSSSAGGGVILGDVRGARLASESDNSIVGFPTVTSCLLTLLNLIMDFRLLLKI